MNIPKESVTARIVQQIPSNILNQKMFSFLRKLNLKSNHKDMNLYSETKSKYKIEVAFLSYTMSDGTVLDPEKVNQRKVCFFVFFDFFLDRLLL